MKSVELRAEVLDLDFRFGDPLAQEFCVGDGFRAKMRRLAARLRRNWKSAVTEIRISGHAQDGVCAAIEFVSTAPAIGARKSYPLTATLAPITMTDESFCLMPASFSRSATKKLSSAS